MISPIKIHFFSTLCNDADMFIFQTLYDLIDNKITVENAFENLKKVESYDENDIPYFPEADMTKETKHDFVENVVLITEIDEDTIWSIYDRIFYY
jgi:hypothetical protein